METSKSKLIATLTKPAVIGLASYVSAMLLDSNGLVYLKFINSAVSIPTFYAMLGFGSSLVSTPLKEYLLPMIPNNQWSESEGMILGPAVHAGVNGIAVYWLTNGNEFSSAVKIALLSEIGGDYVYNTAIKPYSY